MTNHTQLCHMWANRAKERGQGYAIFFEGDTIYSHGRHFPIAKHVVNRKGERAILFTTRRYSVSTGKHVSYTRSAIRHDATVFYVERPDETPGPEMRPVYEARIAEAFQKASRARTYIDVHIRDAQRHVIEANAFAAFYGYRWRLAMPSNAAEAIERAKKQDRKRQAKARKELAQRAAEWIAGKHMSLHNHPDVLLRLRGDNIETSRGAQFPVEHGKRAFRLIAACQARGAGWQRNGHTIHLGHFELDAIEPNGDVRAGCHFVKWSEIARLGAELGLSATVAEVA